MVIAVAFWMGRQCGPMAEGAGRCFRSGAVIGSALIYVAVRLGVPGIAGVGRAAAGVFIAQFLFGLVWAVIGYRFGRPRP